MSCEIIIHIRVFIVKEQKDARKWKVFVVVF